MIYRTLNDIKVIDPSLRTLRFNRSLRDAGWPDELTQEDDRAAGAAILQWGLLCAGVALVLWWVLS